MSSDLEGLRQQIDAIDRMIVEALGKRMELVESIGAYKKTQGLNPVDPVRKEEVLATRAAWAEQANLTPAFIREIFERIHAESVAREENA